MLLFMFDINPCSIFLSLSSSIYYCHSISAVNSKVLKLKIVFPIKHLSKFHYGKIMVIFLRLPLYQCCRILKDLH